MTYANRRATWFFFIETHHRIFFVFSTFEFPDERGSSFRIKRGSDTRTLIQDYKVPISLWIGGDDAPDRYTVGITGTANVLACRIDKLPMY